MRLSVKVLLAFGLCATIGLIYDAISWRYHLPYIGLNWLGPLIGADGERGYDAMDYEYFIDFGTIGVLVFLATRTTLAKIRKRA